MLSRIQRHKFSSLVNGYSSINFSGVYHTLKKDALQIGNFTNHPIMVEKGQGNELFLFMKNIESGRDL
jgi:hypothetical protein